MAKIQPFHCPQKQQKAYLTNHAMAPVLFYGSLIEHQTPTSENVENANAMSCPLLPTILLSPLQKPIQYLPDAQTTFQSQSFDLLSNASLQQEIERSTVSTGSTKENATSAKPAASTSTKSHHDTYGIQLVSRHFQPGGSRKKLVRCELAQ